MGRPAEQLTLERSSMASSKAAAAAGSTVCFDFMASLSLERSAGGRGAEGRWRPVDFLLHDFMMKLERVVVVML